ncbi:Spy/CpxP family protein refolding chaperone [Aestuariivirga sp.]|uniref:Spy/CpxP family protein refolding chaperone n=1 Tax=Aestuariivirga sp. TaxID=2650926 RepID=UPI00391ADFA2
MNRSAWTSLATAAAVMVCLAGPVSAQDQDGDGNSWWPRWGMGQGMMGGGWGPMMGYGPGDLLDRIDGRLAFLKTELKVTPAQEAAWNDLATVVRDTSETHNKLMIETHKEMRDGSFFDKPLPERLQIQQSHMEARLVQIKSVKEAVDKLYALLDDDQKKVADDIVLPMMGMGMGRGRGRMGPGMMFGD